jgi:hypothetical protein
MFISGRLVPVANRIPVRLELWISCSPSLEGVFDTRDIKQLVEPVSVKVIHDFPIAPSLYLALRIAPPGMGIKLPAVYAMSAIFCSLVTLPIYGQ